MPRGSDLILVGAAIAALLLWPRRASGMQVTFPGTDNYDYTDDMLPQWAKGYHDPVYDAEDGPEFSTPESWMEYPGEEVPALVDWFAGAGSVSDLFNRNTDALLDTIMWAEHSAADAASGDAYRTFYGGARFNGFSDHPVITGELKPVPLPERFCRAAGYMGTCYSSAAGAFQITKPTWVEYRARGPYLADFSPANQREAARRILNSIGALKLLQAGDLQGAIARASARWASLPGSTAGQGGKSYAAVERKFVDSGGVA